MPSHSDRYYQSSGRIPFVATPLMIAAGVVAAFVLSLPLVLIATFVDRVVVALMCSLGLGVLAGLTVRGIGRLAQVRHPDFARFVGLVVGVFAVYFAWVWFAWGVNEFNIPVLQDRFAHPEHLLRDMQGLAAVGPWSIAGYTPRGWELYGVWIAEAVSIIVLTVSMSADDAETYCERCRRWTRDSGLLVRMPLCDPDELRRTLEADLYGILDDLRQQPCDMQDRHDLKIAECPGCADSNYLTIERMTVTKDADKKTVTTSRPIVTNLIVPRALVEHLALPVFDGNPAYGSIPEPEPEAVEVS
ncbi:MAG: hypothetical protein ACE5KM_23360 [Planctomycetaceae bacterium]